MRSFTIFCLCYFWGINGYGQSSIDSVIMTYLRTVPGIPTPFLEITKEKGRISRSANFFIEVTDSLRHQDIILKSFIFGPSASHARKYFLLQINSNGILTNKIVDSPNLEDGIVCLLSYLRAMDLSDAEKSVLVRELTYAYH